MVFSWESNQANLIDVEGWIFVIIIEGIISIIKHKTRVPIFKNNTAKKSILIGTSET